MQAILPFTTTMMTNSLPIVTDESHCKYPSKRCLNKRAVKKTGELHSFCDYHRARANRNQRRLELKKRCTATTEEMQATNVAPQWQPNNDFDAFLASLPRYEPCQVPTQLLDEDLHALSLFITDSPVCQ